MRRLLFRTSAILLTALSCSLPASAQHYQQRTRPTAAPASTINQLALQQPAGNQQSTNQVIDPTPNRGANQPRRGAQDQPRRQPQAAPPNRGRQNTPPALPPTGNNPQRSAQIGNNPQRSAQIGNNPQRPVGIGNNPSTSNGGGMIVSPPTWTMPIPVVPVVPVYPFPYIVQPIIIPPAPAPPLDPNDPNNAIDPNEPAADPPVAAKAPRATNAEQKARAGKFIGFGDAQFAEQKYLAAADRYRTAGETAPDLAEGFMRQGFAYVAMGQYDNAAKAFRRGIAVQPDWSDSDFRVDLLYKNDKLAKGSHVERLAKAIEDNPTDANQFLALGMVLYFDNQRDRSTIFLRRAGQLGHGDDKLLVNFLKPAPTPPAPAVQAPPAPAPALQPPAQAAANGMF